MILQKDIKNLGEVRKIFIDRLWDKCPQCDMAVPSEDDYIKYPETSSRRTVTYYCKPCDHTWYQDWNVLGSVLIMELEE